MPGLFPSSFPYRPPSRGGGFGFVSDCLLLLLLRFAHTTGDGVENIDGHDSGTESDGDLEQEDDLIQEHEMELSGYEVGAHRDTRPAAPFDDCIICISCAQTLFLMGTAACLAALCEGRFNGASLLYPEPSHVKVGGDGGT
uniref:Uncharacterized protein n=1 Tax=Anopheles farauti TaxID=69004 RepID=A0A182QB90_9DIPT